MVKLSRITVGTGQVENGCLYIRYRSSSMRNKAGECKSLYTEEVRWLGEKCGSVAMHGEDALATALFPTTPYILNNLSIGSAGCPIENDVSLRMMSYPNLFYM